MPVPTRRASFFQRGALNGETDFGKPQEDEAEDGRGIFLRLQFGIGAQLVGGIPEAFFQRRIVSVFFRWGDSVHKIIPA